MAGLWAVLHPLMRTLALLCLGTVAAEGTAPAAVASFAARDAPVLPYAPCNVADSWFETDPMRTASVGQWEGWVRSCLTLRRITPAAPPWRMLRNVTSAMTRVGEWVRERVDDLQARCTYHGAPLPAGGAPGQFRDPPFGYGGCATRCPADVVSLANVSLENRLAPLTELRGAGLECIERILALPSLAEALHGRVAPASPETDGSPRGPQRSVGRQFDQHRAEECPFTVASTMLRATTFVVHQLISCTSAAFARPPKSREAAQYVPSASRDRSDVLLAVIRAFARRRDGEERGAADCIDGGVADFNASAPVRVVEVGAARGVTSFWILRNCRECHLTIVDPWDRFLDPSYLDDSWEPYDVDELRRFRETVRNMARYFPGRVEIIERPSVAGSKRVVDESVDVVFLDGDHTAAGIRSDIAVWAPKVRRGGIISGHDYGPLWPDVGDAVHAYAEDKNYPVHVGFGDVWWLWKERP